MGEMAVVPSERNRAALERFAPIAETYNRYASLLSFGPAARWRSFLVSRVGARPGETVLDVATGTGAVALELVRRYGCRVVGVDQSAAMLACARKRIASTGRSARVDLVEARAEDLPFADATFDGLTVTYLLRYVDDPKATLRELARVVRPGGHIASLEFGVPVGRLPNALWRAYVGVGLPLAGAAIAPGWRSVGSFLGPSIRAFWARYPLETLLAAWRSAGIEQVGVQRLSLGGGVVIWGERGF